MIELGVSSACYYPLETERSVEKIVAAGFPSCEIFFNSPSELEPDYLKRLQVDAESVKLRIRSVHPFMSFAESFFLFSSYRRRYLDLLPFYERFFAVTKQLDADIFVFHGIKKPGSIPESEYFERFSVLTEMGKKYGVQVCQENVVHYQAEDPGFLKRMAAAVGPNFGVALDLKQARRMGIDYRRILDTVGAHVRHIHISDFTVEADCLPPGEGVFDFPAFFRELKGIGYSGACIIELYRDSYTDEAQIVYAYDFLKNLLPL